MSITVHEFDGITHQFRIKPHEMPTMSTPTMTANYTTIKEFELVLRENALAIFSYQTHLALVVSPKEYAEVNNNIPSITLANPGLRAANAQNTKAHLESSCPFTF